MSTDNYKGNFYQQIAWMRVRDQVMKEYSGLCQTCLQMGLIVPADVVHHIIPISPKNIQNPEITLNKANLIPLCHLHHNEIHKRKEILFTFDDEGNICAPSR